MQNKILIFLILTLFLLSLVVSQTNTNQTNTTNQTINETCIEDWQCGSWSSCVNEQQTRTCTDSNNCNTTINKSVTSQNCTIQDTNDTTMNVIESQKVCCHKFGYGNQMKKVNSKYQWIGENDCVTPEGFVGGGREIVDDEYCKKRISPNT